MIRSLSYGSGTFEVRTARGERKPAIQDRQIVSVETHGVAIFRPGKELKDYVWDCATKSE